MPRSAPERDVFVADMARVPAPRREVLAATDPYSAQERVLLALEAIEHVALHTAEMEQQLTDFVRDSHVSATGVVFVPEEFEDAPRTEFNALTDNRENAVSTLRSLVARLRKEIGADADHR